MRPAILLRHRAAHRPWQAAAAPTAGRSVRRSLASTTAEPRKASDARRRPIALAADHAGYELKDALKAEIAARGLGRARPRRRRRRLRSTTPTWRTPWRRPWATAARGAACWSAAPGSASASPPTGTATSAPRLCHDVTTARLARQHNDANVLVLGARVVGASVAADCLGGVPRHAVRGRPAPAPGREARLTRALSRVRGGCYSPAAPAGASPAVGAPDALPVLRLGRYPGEGFAARRRGLGRSVAVGSARSAARASRPSSGSSCAICWWSRRTAGGLPFDRDKLARSIRIATRKRGIDEEQIERIVNGIVRRIETSGETEVPSTRIGELAMESLAPARRGGLRPLRLGLPRLRDRARLRGVHPPAARGP